MCHTVACVQPFPSPHRLPYRSYRKYARNALDIEQDIFHTSL